MMKKIITIGAVIVVCLIAGYLLLWQKEIIYSPEFTIKEKAGEITCNEKCKSSGYVSGVCKLGSGAIVDCGTDAVSIGQTSDCKLAGETGGTWKSCCCNK